MSSAHSWPHFFFCSVTNLSLKCQNLNWFKKFSTTERERGEDGAGRGAVAAHDNATPTRLPGLLPIRSSPNSQLALSFRQKFFALSVWHSLCVCVFVRGVCAGVMRVCVCFLRLPPLFVCLLHTLRGAAREKNFAFFVRQTRLISFFNCSCNQACHALPHHAPLVSVWHKYFI